MNNRIRQHIPAFVDGVEPGKEWFDTLEELCAIPWVGRWLTDPSKPRGRLTQHRNLGRSHLLIVVYGDYESWWVVGYLDEPMDELEEWAQPPGNKKPPTQ